MRSHSVPELYEAAMFMIIDFVTKKWFHAVYRTDRDRYVDFISSTFDFLTAYVFRACRN